MQRTSGYDVCARLRADVGRYSFTVRDLHPPLLAGLPAHSKTLHMCGHSACRAEPPSNWQNAYSAAMACIIGALGRRMG
jgi:hypothetical protein